jgi:pyruvate/2-oxoglutarate dehydrogenase complex dihydrolipoamide acyltransferase (E2) component
MTTFHLPDLGEGLPDAEIREWYVKRNDWINIGEPMVAMETAKAVVDIPAPFGGRVTQLYGQVGDIIKTGDALIDIGEESSKTKKNVEKNQATVVGHLQQTDTILEESLSHFASLVGGQFATAPGAGAAGGFGFMAYAFLNAEARSGIDLILDLVEFDSKIAGADAIITGEGRFDSQSVQGKAPWGILQRAAKLSIPTYLVCGDADTHHASGYVGIHTLTSIESDIDKCITNPAHLVAKLGASIAKLLQ